jgi:hypothetical protein
LIGSDTDIDGAGSIVDFGCWGCRLPARLGRPIGNQTT